MNNTVHKVEVNDRKRFTKWCRTLHV